MIRRQERVRLTSGSGRVRKLEARKATAAGDGFADGFPIEALIDLLKARLARPQLTKADWVAFSAVGRG